MVRVEILGVALCAALALAACKTPQDLQEPTGEASTGVKQIAVGAGFTAAVFGDGHVRMLGTPLPRKPTGMRGIDFGGKVAKLAAGRVHVCALLESGAVRCMGRNLWGELGYGHTDPIENPAEAGDVPLAGKAVDLSVGHGYTCALLEGGATQCWGSGQGGRLGYGNREDVYDPSKAGNVPVGGSVHTIDTGAAGITCAVLTTGKVRCWGQALQGSLGYASVEDIGATNTPESVGDVQLPAKVVDVAVGSAHVCVTFETGNVRCWGFGGEGRLGHAVEGNIGDDETPLQAKDVDLGGVAVALEAGGTQTCAILKSGNVRCWGIGRQGQLGYGNRSNVGFTETPAQVGDVKLGGTTKQLAASPTHTCALLEAGEVMCWGQEIGNGQSVREPIRVDFGSA